MHSRRTNPKEIWDDAMTVVQDKGKEVTTPHTTIRNYHDHFIDITLMGPSTHPRIAVEVSRDDQLHLVFTASHNSPAKPGRYNPGRWTHYLNELAEHARSQHETLKPFDDARLFPAYED